MQELGLCDLNPVQLPEGTPPSCSRRGSHSRLHAEEDSPVDPDNMPARSRLFLVVPKAADAAAIEVSTSGVLSSFAASSCIIILAAQQSPPSVTAGTFS